MTNTEDLFKKGEDFLQIVGKAKEFTEDLLKENERLRFRIQVRGQVVEVDMTPEGTTYELLEGRGLPVKHFGEQLRVLPGQPVHRPAVADDLPLAA